MRIALRLGGPALALAAGLALLPATAHATFHLMQIERVIGGVNGDCTAQAIQLRMRSLGQNLVSQGRLYAWDATGNNPILLLDMTTNVANSAAGSRVLIASANMAQYSSVTPNFVMTRLIPPSYLAAGKITYEDDLGDPALWVFAWGGSSYTGDEMGDIVNDVDGNFAPPFPGPLPYTSLQGVVFTGSASAVSTNNAADYTLAAGALTLTNNAGVSGAIAALPACSVIAGSDLFVTPPSGITFDMFASSPIPAAFFGPNSDPFTGEIALGGVPLAPSSPLGPTDTVVRRDASAVLSGPSATATVPIEIVALSLASITPITVTYNGGTAPEHWTVQACLSNHVQTAGTLHLTTSACACNEGGTFTSTLPVLPKLIFTRTIPTPATVTLDFSTAGRPAISYAVNKGHYLTADPGVGLATAGPGVRVDGDCNPASAAADLLPTTNFVTGGRADHCAANSCAGPATLSVRMTQEIAPSAQQGFFPAPATLGTDTDGDGTPDNFDDCKLTADPNQTDTDDDGIGDACDNCGAIYNPCQEDANSNGVGDVCEVASVPSPLPARVALSAPAPNPARETIGFTVALPKAANVRLGVFDVHGRRVGSPLVQSFAAGVHRLDWKLAAAGEAPLRSGTYYLRLEASGVRLTRMFQIVH